VQEQLLAGISTRGLEIKECSGPDMFEGPESEEEGFTESAEEMD